MAPERSERGEDATIREGARTEFLKRLEPFEQLARPEATTSD